MFSNSIIKKAQEAQLIIMDIVHKICVAYNIKYYIIGGTALGAKRHNGFIPWDVDIDIAMLRDDYEKFLSLAPTELSPLCECRYFGNTKNHISPHALIVLKNSRLVFNTDKINNIHNREVYIDVMPLDTAPLSLEKQKKQARNLRKISKIKYYKHSAIYNNNSNIVAFLKRGVRGILSIISWRRLNILQHKIMIRHRSEESNFVCSMASQYSYAKQCMDMSIYGEPQLVEFENRLYYAPQQLDKYLTRIYGDYMQLPSVEKQQEQASLIVDVSVPNQL